MMREQTQRNGKKWEETGRNAKNYKEIGWNGKKREELDRNREQIEGNGKELKETRFIKARHSKISLTTRKIKSEQILYIY